MKLRTRKSKVMKAKQLLLTPKLPPINLDTLRLGDAVANRFKDILVSNEASLDEEGIKYIKRELALTIRHETGNDICLADEATAIDDAVSEYVDSFMQNLHFKDAQNAFYLSQQLARRIYDIV